MGLEYTPFPKAITNARLRDQPKAIRAPAFIKNIAQAAIVNPSGGTLASSRKHSQYSDSIGHFERSQMTRSAQGKRAMPDVMQELRI